jgi:hypothetical protein
MSAIDSSMQAKGMQLQMGSVSPSASGAGIPAAVSAAEAEASATEMHHKTARMLKTAKARSRFIGYSPFCGAICRKPWLGADEIGKKPLKCAGFPTTLVPVKRPSAKVLGFLH